MFTLVEAHAISRHDLADWPILGRGARRVGTLFVDRESRRSGADVLRKTDAALAAGEGVMMFPEGTSFIGDEVRPLRPGAFKAAQRAGAQIVPVGIAYDNDAVYYYKEPFLTHLSRLASQTAIRVAASAGEPMTTVGRDPVELKEAAHAAIQQLVNQARRQLGGTPAPPRVESAETTSVESSRRC
jgi:1-acyl-sn-glycerol-3-phosphate acyltransferase